MAAVVRATAKLTMNEYRWATKICSESATTGCTFWLSASIIVTLCPSMLKM